jgi:hypothetical protein
VARAEQVEHGDELPFYLGQVQALICCDCGLAHDLTLVSTTTRRAVIRIEINARATAAARKGALYPMLKRRRKTT